MNYLNAFLFCGIVCLIGQIILDNSKLTPGHVTSIFVVIGALMAFFNLYEPIRSWAGAGATLPIVSFGDLLFKGGYDGFKDSGILGIFKNFYTTTSAGISASVIFSFLFTIFSRPKD